MDSELKNLRIDRSKKRPQEGPSRWAKVWIFTGIAVFLLLGAWRAADSFINRAVEVEVVRVRAASMGDATRAGDVILNATGYIIAAHKIQVAAKVVGKVAWIGVEKGDRVTQGQVLVRLEDDEYRAQVQQAAGALANMQARLEQLMNGSRPEEIAKAKADLESSRSDLQNAKITLERTRKLVQEGVFTKQNLDDAQAKYDGLVARMASIERTYDLVKLGPRREEIAAARAQVEQAKGVLAYGQTQLENTVIKAPVTGTILDRNVERGEFVTTGFVGDRGAKGYVVSLADLNDLKVELDINQNDFAKLSPKQKGVITTDAFPDRKYDGAIDEVSPEANRQKATVQVKVKVLKPDQYLRPEMNASVAFLSDAKPAVTGVTPRPAIVIPASAVKGDAVFVLSNGRAVKRSVKTGATVAQGVRIEDGLIGGEDLIVNPPATLKDGDSVKAKG
ncbi:MAG TPA: efflux RND transporter periplasmic adaptor subunit [Bryobacteraceae bacterium]|nr:efflux RND transporter periplasmic adaptor subunit [Bryobacteraceae bacterium]